MKVFSDTHGDELEVSCGYGLFYLFGRRDASDFEFTGETIDQIIAYLTEMRDGQKG